VGKSFPRDLGEHLHMGGTQTAKLSLNLILLFQIPYLKSFHFQFEKILSSLQFSHVDGQTKLIGKGKNRQKFGLGLQFSSLNTSESLPSMTPLTILSLKDFGPWCVNG
jgi:hypothetical protein